MEELVKKEPVTASLDTTKSGRLIVLDAHTSSSSSSRTSPDCEKEIEKLENQFQGSQPQTTPLNKIWISKYRGKESFETFHKKRIASKYYRKQKLKNDDAPYKKKQSSTPKAPGKCFKCGKRGHLRTKCESKDRTLTNTIVSHKPHKDLVSTLKPRI